MNLLLAFALALLLTIVLIPPLMRLANRLGVLDQPAERKVHDAPLPRIGGVAMGLATLATLLLWLPHDELLLGFLAGAGCLLVFGAIDDRYTLGPAAKALSQLAAVLAFLFISGVQFDSVIVTNRAMLPAWLGTTATVAFLMFAINAVNLSDGLDGLAGGLTLLTCAALALAGLTWHEPFVQAVAIVVAGALFGFLRFNTWPARLFMGDAGSQFLGFTVGALGVRLTQEGVAPVPAALLLFLIGVPLIDTLAVMALRAMERRSIFTGDRRHLHHRLLALGFDHYEVVAAIYVLQFLLMLIAWELRFASDLLTLAVFAMVTVGSILALSSLEEHDWQWRKRPAREGSSPLARGLRWLAESHRLPRWSMRFACVATTAYWLAVALFADPAPPDVRWMAAAAALFACLCLALRHRLLSGAWSLRCSLYLAVITAVYLDHFTLHHAAPLQLANYVFLPTLAIAVTAAVRFAPAKRFGATPTDLLLIVGVLALPNVAGLQSGMSDLGISIAKLFALCFAVEMIATLGSRLPTMLLSAAALFFLLVAARAWL